MARQRHAKITRVNKIEFAHRDKHHDLNWGEVYKTANAAGQPFYVMEFSDAVYHFSPEQLHDLRDAISQLLVIEREPSSVEQEIQAQDLREISIRTRAYDDGYRDGHRAATQRTNSPSR